MSRGARIAVLIVLGPVLVAMVATSVLPPA